MVGKLAGVGPFFIPMQLPSVPRHQRMHACWLDPKRSQDLGRRSLAPFFPPAKIIFQKKKPVFWFERLGLASLRRGRSVSTGHLSCHMSRASNQGANSPLFCALPPAPALLRCVHSVVPISKPAHPTAADPCRHRCRASNNARPDPALRCSPPRIAALSFSRPWIRRLNCAGAPFSSQTLAFRHSSPLRPAHSRNSPAET